MARLKISLILESGARIGPGKAALLESVRDTGSISAAARAMGMDYKRAWTLIDSLNRAFDRPVVERATGGSGGGGATLTPFVPRFSPNIAGSSRRRRSLARVTLRRSSGTRCPIPVLRSD